jgi:hypothetical protein
MLRLYRSTRDLQHWFVCDRSARWVRFPARINGWADRQAIRNIYGLDLREVPLWMSFDTGLPMAARKLGRAA